MGAVEAVLMFTHAFVRNAYLAGTFIALASGCVGWFVVARGQLFAGDALSHVAFVGAIGAAVLGLDERVGLFALTLAVAGAMAALGRTGRPDDAVIGTVFAWILGIGILLLTLLSTSASGGTGVSTANTLFGSIYSLSSAASRLSAAIALAVTAALAIAARPLLLSTLDSVQAAARGVPVKLLGAGILAAVAVVTAEGTQAVGALLLLGLLSAPAGAAHKLTWNPYAGIALSGLLAVAATWGGLALSYAIPSLPASSAIIGLATATFAVAAVIARLRGRSPGDGGFWTARASGGPASGADGSRGPGRRRIL
jgi:zinc/manganese transport system permease protein